MNKFSQISLAKRLLPFLFFMMLSAAVYSQAFQWAIQSGGNGISSTSDRGEAVTVDNNGNVLMTGIFEGTANFDTAVLTSAGGLDIFIEKRNAAGDFIWAVRAGGTQLDKPNAIATDNAGNVYITGQFSGTATFGSTPITANGIDIFVAKYNSNGVFQWARVAGGGSVNRGLGIATDNDGNVIVVGDFGGTATFATTNLTSAGAVDIFIAKYNTNGQLTWAQRAGGSVNDRATSVATDNAGNIYFAGSFGGTANFDGTNITATGGAYDTDIFVAKYTAAGNISWVKKAGTTGGDVEEAKAIALDPSGNVLIGGVFFGTANFDGQNVTSSGSSDGFLAKYNNNGVIQWVKNMGSTSDDETLAIAALPDGSIVAGGFFKGVFSAGQFALTAFGGVNDFDGFLVKYAPNGNEQWVKRMGRVGEDKAHGVACDHLGNIYATGFFRTNILFDHIQLNSQGSSDAFLTQINDFITLDTLAQHTYCAGDSIFVYFNANTVFDAANVFTLELSDATGDFGNPVSIGSLNSSVSGHFATVLPNSLTQGTNYRVRVTSTVIPTVSLVYPLAVTINEKPDAPVLISSGTLCLGDTLTEVEVAGQNIFWYNDYPLTNEIGTGNALTVNQQLISDTVFYAIDVSTENCASDVSQIDINIFDIPVINYAGPDTMLICENEPAVVIDMLPTGGIFTGSGIVAPDVFLPADAQEGLHLINYTYTDTNNCTAYKEIYFDVLPIPIVTIDTVTDLMIGYFDTLYLSGTPAGGTFSGIGVTDNYFVGTPDDGCMPCIIYYIYEADNGCLDTASISVSTYINNIQDSEQNAQFVIYPNPAEKDIIVTVLLEKPMPVLVQIFDISGRLLFEENYSIVTSGVFNINISLYNNGIGKGFYILVVETPELRNTSKFTVIN